MYMNELRGIWNESKLSRCGQSPISQSEDETTMSMSSTSICESAKSSGYGEDRKGTSEISANEFDASPTSSFPLTTHERKPSSSRGIISLSSAIPIAELSQRTRDEILSKIVHVKQGYIHVLKLAQMIEDSFHNNSFSS